MDFHIDDGILRWDDGSCRPATETEKHMKAEIERLESDMSAMIQRHAAEVKTLESMLAESRKNDLYAMKLLAESQAREAKLRDYIFDYVDIDPNEEGMLARYFSCVKPVDDTALKEYRREVLKCVIAEWEKPYGLTDGTSFITRLRRMAEES